MNHSSICVCHPSFFSLHASRFPPYIRPSKTEAYGTVIAVGDEAFTLRLTHGSASKLLTVVSSESVASGDTVEVLGVITGDELTLIPEDMIVSK